MISLFRRTRMGSLLLFASTAFVTNATTLTDYLDHLKNMSIAGQIDLQKCRENYSECTSLGSQVMEFINDSKNYEQFKDHTLCIGKNKDDCRESFRTTIEKYPIFIPFDRDFSIFEFAALTSIPIFLVPISRKIFEKNHKIHYIDNWYVPVLSVLWAQFFRRSGIYLSGFSTIDIIATFFFSRHAWSSWVQNAYGWNKNFLLKSFLGASIFYADRIPYSSIGNFLIGALSQILQIPQFLSSIYSAKSIVNWGIPFALNFLFPCYSPGLPTTRKILENLAMVVGSRAFSNTLGFVSPYLGSMVNFFLGETILTKGIKLCGSLVGTALGAGATNIFTSTLAGLSFFTLLKFYDAIKSDKSDFASFWKTLSSGLEKIWNKRQWDVKGIGDKVAWGVKEIGGGIACGAKSLFTSLSSLFSRSVFKTASVPTPETEEKKVSPSLDAATPSETFSSPLVMQAQPQSVSTQISSSGPAEQKTESFSGDQDIVTVNTQALGNAALPTQPILSQVPAASTDAKKLNSVTATITPPASAQGTETLQDLIAKLRPQSPQKQDLSTNVAAKTAVPTTVKKDEDAIVPSSQALVIPKGTVGQRQTTVKKITPKNRPRLAPVSRNIKKKHPKKTTNAVAHPAKKAGLKKPFSPLAVKKAGRKTTPSRTRKAHASGIIPVQKRQRALGQN